MENQNNDQQKNDGAKEIKNEFLLQLKELASKAPKNVTLSILAVENETSDSYVFEGLILAAGKPRKLVSMYGDVFDKVPDLKEIIFDAVAFHKFKETFGSKSPATSIFDSIFGSGMFKR